MLSARKFYVNRDALGDEVGHSAGWSELKKYELAFGARYMITRGDVHVSQTTTSSNTLIDVIAGIRTDPTVKRIGPLCIVSLPTTQLESSFDTYWLLLNCGSCLTGKSNGSGNIVRIVASSLASQVARFAHNQGRSSDDLIDTFTWTLQVMKYILTGKSDWTKTLAALNAALRTPNSTDCLQNASLFALAGILGHPIQRLDLICRVVNSIRRTVRDLKKKNIDVISPQGINRFMPFYILLQIMNNVAMDQVVGKARTEFVTALKATGDRSSIQRLVDLIVVQTYPGRTSAHVQLSDLLVELMSQKGHQIAIDVGMLRSKLTTPLHIGDDHLTPLNLDVDTWTVKHHKKQLNPVVSAMDEKTVEVSPQNSSHWSCLVVKSKPNLSLQVHGKYTGGTGGRPGVRLHSMLPTDQADWRLTRDQPAGLSSSGGHSTGYKAPDGAKKVDLTEFMEMAPLCQVDVVGDSCKVKFTGWTIPLEMKCWKVGHCLVISFKGFDLKVIDNTPISTGGGAGGGAGAGAGAAGGHGPTLADLAKKTLGEDIMKELNM